VANPQRFAVVFYEAVLDETGDAVKSRLQPAHGIRGPRLRGLRQG
jgi:hypothetical protein